MINVFKKGGGYKDSNGREYSAKLIHSKKDLPEGYSLTLEDALKESGSDYEKELRDQIKALGGFAAGRSSIKTLEYQLSELKKTSK
jgi:hypothetical protein